MQIQVGDKVTAKGTDRHGIVVGLYDNGVEGVLVRFDPSEEGQEGETVKMMIDGLQIVFGLGVFRDQAEHDAMLSDFRREFEKLEGFKGEVGRALEASKIAEAVEVAEVYGVPLATIKGIVSTLQYATNFVELLADSPRVTPQIKVAIKIAAECVRLLGRAFKVKEF